jgi:hypothetical protein
LVLPKEYFASTLSEERGSAVFASDKSVEKPWPGLPLSRER